MPSFIRVGNPNLSGIEEEVRRNYDKYYGVSNWLVEEGVLKIKQVTLPFAQLYMVTGNEGKFASAKRSLPGIALQKVELDISEEQETTEEVTRHKLRVAYATLCQPVICDDSGFVIPTMGEWPGNRISRVLKEKGVDYFTGLAKNHPLKSYWTMTLGFYDGNEMELFTSESYGHLIGEQRGEIKASAKSPLWKAFIPLSSEKTLAEMTEEELKRQESDRWPRLREFLKERNYFK